MNTTSTTRLSISDRAALAESALNHFSAASGMAETFTEAVAADDGNDSAAFDMCQDLIGNILHLAEAKGWETDRLLIIATDFYELDREAARNPA